MNDLEKARQFFAQNENLSRADLVRELAKLLQTEREETVQRGRQLVEAHSHQMFATCGALISAFENLAVPTFDTRDPGYCIACLRNDVIYTEAKQYRSPGGLTCKQGHGGAESVPECAACKAPVTHHTFECEEFGNDAMIDDFETKFCRICKKTLAWSPSGHYCGNPDCREFNDSPAF